MRRFALLFASLLVCLGGVSVSSASWTASWSVDLGPGYITTSPVTDDERVYVRTSGFWTGEERPEVRAFDHQGELQWTHRHPTTTQHDMSPLLLVSGGTGPCGSWPDLLLVGWANGQVEALHPSNATVVWSINTTVDGWGVTGAMLLDGDRVVVPTRSGLARACLEDGVMDLNVNLSLGWRNGVAKTDDAYWMGSETGHLWKVSLDGRDVRGSTSRGNFVTLRYTSTICCFSTSNNRPQVPFTPMIWLQRTSRSFTPQALRQRFQYGWEKPLSLGTATASLRFSAIPIAGSSTTGQPR